MINAKHKRLSAVVPIWADEPAYGLASRLARRNGVNSLISFGRDQAISYREIVHGLRNAEIAELSGADVGLLDASTFRVDDEQVYLNDESLLIKEWSYTTLRVCPSCIRSDLTRDDGRKEFLPHARTWWNLSLISVCPIHREILLDQYPDCLGAPISHLTSAVRFADQTKGDFAKLDPKPVDDVRAESYILGRLGFLSKTYNPLLDGLPLQEAISLIEKIGAVAEHAFGSLNETVPRRKLLIAGYSAFAKGETGFSNFLDRLLAANHTEPDKRKRGFSYAGVAVEWMAYLRNVSHEPIRKMVFEHLRDRVVPYRAQGK